MHMNIHARLTKVDAENRLVYGLASAEALDRSGEVMDYASSKPNFEKWVAETLAASEGQSHGNVRAMHGKVAAGKLVKIEFDDDNRQIPVCAKIVDDNEWNKVMEGVYTGFSIGGAYGKKWADKDMKKSDGKPAMRYTAVPGELSLVDRPCLPDARFFDIQKADGATEQAEFKAVLTAESIETKCRELCKADGEENPDITNTADGKDEPLWKSYYEAAITVLSPDEPAEAADSEINEYRVEGSDDEVAKLAKLMDDNKMSVASVIELVIARTTADAGQAELDKALADGTLAKGMWLVSRLAGCIEQMNEIAAMVASEEQREGDTASTLPAKAKALLSTALDLLNAMVVEESAELLGTKGGDQGLPVLAMMDTDSMQKIGARNSKLDAERIQKAHDLIVELGGACAAEKLDKSAPVGDLQKMIDSAVAPLQKLLDEQSVQLAKLAAQPAPARGVLRALNKSDDTASQLTEEIPAVKPVLNKDGEVDNAATLIKMAHQLGGVRMGLRPDGSPV